MTVSRLPCLLLVGLVAGTPWRFDDNSRTLPTTEEPYIELQTEANMNYVPLQEIGIEVTRTQSFIFQVRAMREVHLALQTDAGDITERVYEVTLGGWANTLSIIRKGVADGRIMVDHRHHPLSVTEFRTFWINWANGRVSVGSGRTVGANTFMTYRDPVPHPVNYISVSTGWGVTGMWKFEAPYPMIGLWTSPREDLQFHSLTYRGYRAEDRNSLVFWVKASNDANVVLTSHIKPYTNMYWVSLGGIQNTRSFIRKGRMGPDLAHALHRPLSNDYYLAFWASWEGGLVAVGEGTGVGRRQFMAWNDPTPFAVTDVHVSTGEGSDGHWLIDLVDDETTSSLPRSGNSLTLDA